MRSLITIMVLVGAFGRANADDAEDRAKKSDALFAEGQKFKDNNQLDEACAKFDLALELNRNAIGVMLNVALCKQQAGKVASALSLFIEARDLAQEHNLAEHKKAAQDHIDELQPLAPHLAIAFDEPPTSDTKLLIDNQVVDIAKAGDVLVDPGMRSIIVTASGRVPFETKVEFVQRDHKAIAVPRLGYPVTVKSTRRTVGKVLLGVGAAGVITSEVIAWYERGRYRHDIAGCDQMVSPPTCNPDLYAKTQHEFLVGNIATGIGIGGVALAGLGAYLWLFAPKEHADQPKGVAVIPTITPETAGITAVGRF